MNSCTRDPGSSWLCCTNEKRDSVEFGKKSHKFYVYQAVSIFIDLVRCFIQKIEVKFYKLLSHTRNDSLRSPSTQGELGASCSRFSLHPIVQTVRSWLGWALLLCQIKPPLTSTSLFFSLFLPIELLPLLAVSRAGITEIWWRGILAGLQVAEP